VHEEEPAEHLVGAGDSAVQTGVVRPQGRVGQQHGEVAAQLLGGDRLPAPGEHRHGHRLQPAQLLLDRPLQVARRQVGGVLAHLAPGEHGQQLLVQLAARQAGPGVQRVRVGVVEQQHEEE
jgi:hypothetical protein